MFIRPNCLLMDSLGVLKYRFIPSANTDDLISSFLYLYLPPLLPSYLTGFYKNSRAALNDDCGSRHLVFLILEKTHILFLHSYNVVCRFVRYKLCFFGMFFSYLYSEFCPEGKMTFFRSFYIY